MQCCFSNSTTFMTDPPPPHKRPARMSDFIKFIKLSFEQEMGVSSHSPNNVIVAPV